jgi:hypothetical protein
MGALLAPYFTEREKENMGTGTMETILVTGGNEGGCQISSLDSGAVVMPTVKMLKSVTIMGKGTNGMSFQWGTTDEVWGVNNVASQPEYKDKKFDKLFAFDILPKEYIAGMKPFAPICSWQDYADIKFPIDDVIREFGTKYFTNTISYMLAYAAYLRIPEVHIYGVDVTFGAPYAQENRGVEYWIGRAQERGVNVIVPDSSHLLRTVSGAMYGVADHCNMLLYLHERINLINILPREGTYSDALKAQNAWWVLFPKSDEAQAHGVQVQRDPQGNMSFQFGPVMGTDNKQVVNDKGEPVHGGEYISDVHMPPETWDYLRARLKELETSGRLPFGVISAYEKLILSKPEGGN